MFIQVAAANNSVVQGLLINGSLVVTGVNGFEISRCQIISGNTCLVQNSSNVTIYQNIIENPIDVTNSNNILFTNNIFSGYIAGSSATNVVVKNNLFLGTYAVIGGAQVILYPIILFITGQLPQTPVLFSRQVMMYTPIIFISTRCLMQFLLA